jgi:hypothetical protein
MAVPFPTEAWTWPMHPHWPCRTICLPMAHGYVKKLGLHDTAEATRRYVTACFMGATRTGVIEPIIRVSVVAAPKQGAPVLPRHASPVHHENGYLPPPAFASMPQHTSASGLPPTYSEQPPFPSPHSPTVTDICVSCPLRRHHGRHPGWVILLSCQNLAPGSLGTSCPLFTHHVPSVLCVCIWQSAALMM